MAQETMAVSGNTVNTAARAIFLSATHGGRETEDRNSC